MAEMVVKTDLNLKNTSKIINVPSPSNANDVATKSYVDQISAGQSWKLGARVATTTDITLTGAPTSIDGVTLVTNDRVLVKDQSSNVENGIYVFDGVNLARSTDTDTASELNNALVSIQEGTLNSDKTFRQTLVVATLGADAVDWEVYGQSTPDATEAEAGKIRIATQAEVDAGSIATAALTPASLSNSAWVPKRFATDIGDVGTSTSYDVTHNLGTTDVVVTVIDKSTNSPVMAEVVVAASGNTVTIIFSATIDAGSHRVIVIA